MVQLLDHTGSPLPTADQRRRRDVVRALSDRRALRARYDAAQTTTENSKHWTYADGLSAAAANSPDVRRTLRNRARHEVDNNTYARGMVRTLSNMIVGRGPTLQLQSGDDVADSQVELAFWKWARAAKLSQKLMTMRMARCVDGESFALLTTNPKLRHPVKLDLKVYEADQVSRPYISLTDPLFADGITFDDFGNPAAYTLLRRHPGDTGFVDLGTEYETIRASEMIHLFRCERPGQIRGIPEITAALPLFAQLRRYTLAVIAAAEVAADLSVLLETQQSPEDPDELEPLDTIELERRTAMTLPQGWVAKQLKAEQPVTTYAMFKREIVAEIARCLLMPYNIAAGDSSGYNYSSGRLDHQTFFVFVDVDRCFLEEVALEPVFETWWNEARLVPGVLPPELADLPEPPLHDWGWGGHEHVDPLKEANAQRVRLNETHTTTMARECAREGLDWEDVQKQQAKELGITVEELRRLMLQKRFGAPTAAGPAGLLPAPDEDTDEEETEDDE